MEVMIIGRGYGEGRVDVCHSDHKHFHQRLVTARNQFSESER